jgi:cobalt-zinc-cadmium efflux system outer membrane protein
MVGTSRLVFQSDAVRIAIRLCLPVLVATCLAQVVFAQQQVLTWSEAQAQFRAKNPLLLAGEVTIDESRADEITANLRPNPDFSLTWDQFTLFHDNPYRPISQSY